VLFILRSVEADRHEIDGGYSDGLYRLAIYSSPLVSTKGTLFFLYYGQLKQTAMKWIVVIAIAL